LHPQPDREGDEEKERCDHQQPERLIILHIGSGAQVPRGQQHQHGQAAHGEKVRHALERQGGNHAEGDRQQHWMVEIIGRRGMPGDPHEPDRGPAEKVHRGGGRARQRLQRRGHDGLVGHQQPSEHGQQQAGQEGGEK
jgi:hypothetical protein